MSGPTSEAARAGARKVWTHCLRVAAGDHVAVFYDETTEETARVLIAEARALGLEINARFVTVAHQTAFTPANGICGSCRRTLQGALGILTCLSDNTETTPYRRELLRLGASGATRLGHMPGAQLFILEWAVNVDYAHATERCEALALAMAVGEQALIKTHDANGTVHTLRLELGGRRRFPVVSTGIIGAGTWGNLPGGETFIAPVEGTSCGSFAVNGAFKDHVMTPAEALVFHLDGGRVRNVSGDSESVRLFNKRFESAVAAGDPQWNVLAELGVGVNDGIPALTGNSLFDEKCAGTLHVALGDNRGFGGTSDSTVHEDFITRKPSLWIDGKPILLDGLYVLDESCWQDDIQSYPVDGRLDQTSVKLGRTPEAVRTEDNCLRFWHQVAAGRTCAYRVGTAATSRSLLTIYNQIRALDRIPLERVVIDSTEATALTEDRVKAGISILIRHGLVSIVP
jgi:hypothetical protein